MVNYRKMVDNGGNITQEAMQAITETVNKLLDEGHTALQIMYALQLQAHVMMDNMPIEETKVNEDADKT